MKKKIEIDRKMCETLFWSLQFNHLIYFSRFYSSYLMYSSHRISDFTPIFLFLFIMYKNCKYNYILFFLFLFGFFFLHTKNNINQRKNEKRHVNFDKFQFNYNSIVNLHHYLYFNYRKQNIIKSVFTKIRNIRTHGTSSSHSSPEEEK